jgi:YidC/Oxa1 family membrane protein insertase
LLALWYAPEWLVGPMRSLLAWCLHFSGNYGLAIILMTIVVRVIILPLSIYQMKSMKRMQEVQPKMKELQAKHKEEPDKLNQAMMALYKTEGVNPFAGCLPLLVQMPFLGAVYEVLRSPKIAALVADPVFLNIHLNDKSIILAAITVVGMLVQSYLSGVGTDPNQKMMTYMMPILFGYISYQMAAGVALYWVAGTLFGLAQQAIYPGFPKLKGTVGTQGGASG